MEASYQDWQQKSGYAFEAINKEGNKIFMECNSNIGDGTHVMAAKAALLVPLMQAKKLGFHHIITLASSKYLEQACSNTRKPHWQDLAMLADLQTLR